MMLTTPALFRTTTHDIDAQADCLRSWGQRYDQLSTGRFHGEFVGVQLDSVHVFREKMNQRVHQSGVPGKGQICFALGLTQDGEGWFNGSPFASDSLLLLRGDERFDFCTPNAHELIAVTVASDALIAYANTVEQIDFQPAKSGVLAAVPPQVAQLRSFLVALFQTLITAEQIFAHPAFRRAVINGLYGALLAAVRETSASATISSSNRQHIARQARQYIEEHIEEELGVADLCRTLKVSARTLQYSFQETYGLNPMKYLKAVRLNCIRRALKLADPNHDTVGDTAARWGVWHLSHFAADYKEMFGELPSATLARAQHGSSREAPSKCSDRMKH